MYKLLIITSNIYMGAVALTQSVVEFDSESARESAILRIQRAETNRPYSIRCIIL